MYKLIIEDDEGKTTVVPLIRDEISIGRKEGNTIRLTERNVSRRHAKLLKQNGAVFIEDLASYNGIRVNGNRISGRVAVAEGDRIQIGDYVLGLKVEGQAVAGAAEEPALTEDAEAPTTQIDVSELPDSEMVTPQTPARLVCVSSNFAGLEFSLTQATMVIGRVDNNDVVINHRSISRNHAKVLEEHGRYNIVDMDSANGVRVNGDDYNKVELRKGDLIDLGHVRLRFVAPGEDFVFSRDAVIIDTDEGGGNGAKLLALALIALLGVGFVVWWVMGRGGSPTVTPGKADAGLSTKKPVVDQSALLTKIETLLGQREWAQALKKCDELVGAAKVESKERCERAASEGKSKKLFDDAIAAATKNEHQGALELFLKIPKTSTYHLEREKSATYLETRKKYKAQAMGEIDELVKKGDCEGAKKLGTTVKGLLVEEAERVNAKVTTCRVPEPVVPAKVAPRPGGATKVVRRPRSTKRGVGGACRSAGECRKGLECTAGRCRLPRPSDEQLARAKKTKEQAWTAYRNGNFKRTVQLGRQYLRVVPNDQKILAIVGLSACQMKSTKDAKAAYARLNAARRSMLRRLCLRHNIKLP